MNKRFLVVFAALAVAAVPAHAVTVLTVDLSVENQITISATPGSSSVTAAGSDTTGFYLAGIFDGIFDAPVADELITGDLTSAQNTADGTPLLFTSTGAPGEGLNVFSYTDDLDSEFVAGLRAFSGSATWTIDAISYAALVGGAMSGDVYFPADDDGDLPNAFIIGQWERGVAVIPVPAAVWLLGSALFGLRLVGARRQRA
ncbi:MAG: hypothetical protein AAGA68_17830 [Pseudomonadota bacterium]